MGGYAAYGMQGQSPMSSQQPISHSLPGGLPPNLQSPGASSVPILPIAHHAVSQTADPLDVVPIEKQNNAFVSSKESFMERMEREGNSWSRGIYA